MTLYITEWLRRICLWQQVAVIWGFADWVVDGHIFLSSNLLGAFFLYASGILSTTWTWDVLHVLLSNIVKFIYIPRTVGLMEDIKLYPYILES